MKIDILTLFPSMFDGFLTESIIKRAIEKKVVEVNVHNFRDYSLDPHWNVDDTPYGGGKGMLMMAPPIYDCYEHIVASNEPSLSRRVIYMSPSGTVFNQKKASDYILFTYYFNRKNKRTRKCNNEIGILILL